MTKLTYIISDIDKALAFEWIADRLNPSVTEISFILILNKPAALEAFLKSRRISVHTFYYASKKDFPLIFLKLYKLIRYLKPDIIHCHLLYASLIGLTTAWLAGIKFRIYTRHHSDFHHLYFPKGVKWDKWCNKICTKIIAPSRAVKDVLVKLENVDPEKVEIIHHGFDLSYFKDVSASLFAEVKSKYNPRDHQPVIGVISRFTNWKGIQYIIPAFIELLKVYPNAKLLLFNAQGDYKEEIVALLSPIPTHNYQSITFENKLAPCYKLFDIFVHTPIDTQVEAFGQVYVEALAAGVPSIFTLSGIAPDFIKDEHNALTVPFKNSSAILEAMLRILEDENLRNSLVKNGPESVRTFSLDEFVSRLQNLYI